MNRYHENDGSLIVQAQPWRTEEDCNRITRTDGWLLMLSERRNHAPSKALCRHLANLGGSLKLAHLLIRNAAPDAHRDAWMFHGLVRMVEDIGAEGYVVKYAVYTTEEKLQACLIGVLPAREPHDGKFRVPVRFDDLIRANFVAKPPAETRASSPSNKTILHRNQRYRRLNCTEIKDMVTRLSQRLGWTSETLAIKSGLHEHTIRCVETGALVDDDCLSKIALAFQLPEDFFAAESLPVASDEQLWTEFKGAFRDAEQRAAKPITSLEDCDAILTVRGYAIDPQQLPPELWNLRHNFVEAIKLWSRDYLKIGPEEKHQACTALMWCVERLDACGYQTVYVVYASEDGITGTSIEFTSKKRRGLRWLSVPRRLSGLLRAARSREE